MTLENFVVCVTVVAATSVGCNPEAKGCCCFVKIKQVVQGPRRLYVFMCEVFVPCFVAVCTFRVGLDEADFAITLALSRRLLDPEHDEHKVDLRLPEARYQYAAKLLVGTEFRELVHICRGEDSGGAYFFLARSRGCFFW